MSATTVPAILPTEAEVDQLSQLLQRSHDAAERLVWRIDRYVDPDIPERPTLADLGVLWLLAEQLEMQGGELEAFASKVQLLMAAVDSKRIDPPADGDDG